jgi:hypothetical protein
MKMRNLIKSLTFALSGLILAGCVAGQSLHTEYEAPAAVAPVSGATVTLAVTDDRPYVKSGEKAPYYVGRYRAGFGNPWDVSTDNDEPLADILRRDIAEELAALGHPVKAEGAADRGIAISIRDWNFDGYQNGQFWYDLLVTVRSPTGDVLVNSIVKDKIGISGTLWEGAKGGFERDMPRLYPQIIRKLARENDEVSAALNMP